MRNICISIAMLLLIGACSTKGGYSVEEYEKMASALRQQELYSESIGMYNALLEKHELSTEKRANILYQIATMQKDQLVDYKNALASYTKIKALAPDEKFSGNLNKNIIECLERLGRSLDASQHTAETVSLNSASDVKRESVVAEIGEKVITLKDIENVVGTLPDDLTKKQQLVQSFVGSELAARAARRKGLAETPEIRKQLAQFETQLLAQATVREELKGIAIDENDMLNYYRANKSKYGDTTSFESVKQKVHTDYMMEKQSALVAQYIEKLLKADDVKLYLDKIK